MDCESQECPVSAITGRSLELIRIIGEAQLIPGALYRLVRNDPKLWDAAVTLRAERMKADAALKAAIHRAAN